MGAWLGGCGVWRHPGPPEYGLVEGVDHVVAVFGGGGEVAPDGVAVLGAVFAGEPAGDVLLHFGWPQVPFGLVGGRWDLEVVGEAQHVGFAIVQDFQQQPGLALARAGAVAGGVREADQHALAEPGDQLVASGLVDGVVARVAGERLAWWISSCSASVIWAGQCASG